MSDTATNGSHGEAGGGTSATPTLPLPAPLVAHAKSLLSRKKQLERENAIMLFRPHAKQAMFFAAAAFHHRYARTGNRFGKSEMGAAEDVAFALGFRPWLPVGDPLRTLGIPPHPTKGLIITTDWDKSTEVFTETEGEKVGKLIKYIPKACLVSMTKNHSGAIDRLIVRHISGGNSIIRIDTVKSYKQNPAGQESGDNDWIHIDEPIPEGMWKAVSRGLVDRGGRAWFTCTPLSEPWIDTKFIPNPDDFDKENLDPIFDVAASRYVMTGSMDDNPHNRPEDIERYMADLNEDEREARRKGIPLAYSGIVYREFDRNVHVRVAPPAGWSAWSTPPADHCIYIANDYHFKKNNANLFIAVPPDGPAYVYAELWQKLLLDEEVTAIRNILAGRPYQPIIMDPLASTPNKVNDLTAMDEYRMRGLAVLPATKDPVNGIRAVKALLKGRDKAGGPLLVVNSTLARFLFEISRGFIWDSDADKPIKDNDDMMECLYRLVLQGLTYVEPALDLDYAPLAPREIVGAPLDFNFGSTFDEAAPRRLAFAQRYRSGTERTTAHYEDDAIL